MSKIEELIEKLCPNGVEYQELKNKNLFKFYYGKGNKIPEDIGGIYDVYGANGVVSHINEYNCEDVSIIGHIGAVGMVNRCKGKCFVTYNGTIAEVVDKTKVNSQYLYYVLTTLNLPSYKKGSQPFLSVSDFERIKIAVPPLEVQDEIVHILDDFTLLSAELSAELKARQKQYNFYLNDLLDINKLKPTKIMFVKDLFEIKNGLNKEKGAFGKGTPIVNFTDVYNKRYLTAEMLKGKVTLSDAEIERYRVKKGDVFFTRTSETKEDIGMSSTVIEDIPNCTFSGFVLRARPLTNLLLPKFCSYYFSTNQVRDNIVRYASFTTRATTSGTKLAKIPVPIIPIEKQEKIVSILDKFDKLCNDISEGIPAEIEARQKQYEYYRNKLLTFKELVNEG